jgi:hypothetical protein
VALLAEKGQTGSTLKLFPATVLLEGSGDEATDVYLSEVAGYIDVVIGDGWRAR